LPSIIFDVQKLRLSIAYHASIMMLDRKENQIIAFDWVN
jgi:hypothetical protein